MQFHVSKNEGLLLFFVSRIENEERERGAGDVW